MTNARIASFTSMKDSRTEDWTLVIWSGGRWASDTTSNSIRRAGAG